MLETAVLFFVAAFQIFFVMVSDTSDFGGHLGIEYATLCSVFSFLAAGILCGYWNCFCFGAYDIYPDVCRYRSKRLLNLLKKAVKKFIFAAQNKLPRIVFRVIIFPL